MAKGTWFTVELIWLNDTETKRFCFKNCDAKTVHKLRATMLDEGLQLPVDAETWVIIFPWQLRSMMVFRQAAFWYKEASSLDQTVFSPTQTIKND